MPPLHVRDHALEGRVVGPLPAVPVPVADVDLLVEAVEQRVPRPGRQPLPRRIHTEAHRIAERLDQPGEVVADVAAAPRRDRALGQRLRGIGDDELRIDLHAGAEAGAVRAGAPGRVERERARLQLIERQVVVEAGQVLGVHPLPVRIVVGQVHEVEHDHPAGQRQGRLHRVGQPAPGRVLHGQPVHDDLDVVLLVLLQRGQVTGVRAVQAHHLAVHPGPREPLGLKLPEQVRVLALAAAHYRRQHLEPGPLLEFQHPVHDLLRGLPRDRAAADRAVRLAHPRVQQPQVVVDLGDGTDRRPGVAAGRLLVDRNGRGQPVDEVDVGLVHLAQELPGVRGQRFDVPPLALGEDRVEGQARLAGTGQPGEHDQGISWQVDRDVLEVVLACAANDKSVSHWTLCFLWALYFP